MFVHETGPLERPTIVFLHGNGANGSMWKSHMEQLADFHCLAPDFPGFGQSRSLSANRNVSKSYAEKKCLGRTFIRGGQAISPTEKVSLTRIEESEYRRRVGCSRTEHQKIVET